MRKFSIAVTVVAVALGAAVLAPPASAVDIRFSDTCIAQGTRLSNGAYVDKGTCARDVRARADVRSSSGSVVSYYGTFGRSSTATGPTTMVVFRGARVSGGAASWSSF